MRNKKQSPLENPYCKFLYAPSIINQSDKPKIRDFQNTQINFIQMSANIIELDNMDEYLLYEDRESNHSQSQNSSYGERKGLNTPIHHQKDKSSNNKFQKNLPPSKVSKPVVKEIPSKFVIRPVTIKYIDKILNMYLEEKTPTKIQQTLKEPTLNEVQCILKEKIHTFLNIVFESSHCYTEEQVQKIKPEVDKKIDRISTEMLDPLPINFIDEARYKNFLKLMRFHKEGRRSQKIAKKCNSFFNLFFMKMKFQNISHTQGNVVDLNEGNKRGNDQLEEDISDSDNLEKGKKNTKKGVKIQQSWNKKYNYPKEQLVSQKLMNEACSTLISEIRSKKDKNSQQTEDNTLKKNPTLNNKTTQPESSPIEVEEVQSLKLFEWNFDKQNTLLYLLTESLLKKHKASLSIKMISRHFFTKYQIASVSNLNLQQITSKIQSMYSVSCQKFIRRIKFMTMKEGLQSQNGNQKKNMIKSSSKSGKKRQLYSIMQIQRIIESENDKKSLSKEDEFYFNNLKEMLKKLDLKQIYFSSYEGAVCGQEWKFVLQFIRECYFTTLQDIKFEYLLLIVQRLMEMMEINKGKNLAKEPLPIEDDVDNADEGNPNHSQSQNKQIQLEKDLLLERLPKSSFSLALSKMRKMKDEKNLQKDNQQRSEKSTEKQSDTQKPTEEFQSISLDEILKRSSSSNKYKHTQNVVKKQPLAIINKKSKEVELKVENDDRNSQPSFKRGRQQSEGQSLLSTAKSKSGPLGQPLKKIKPTLPIENEDENRQQINKIKDEYHDQNVEDEEFEEILEISEPQDYDNDAQEKSNKPMNPPYRINPSRIFQQKEEGQLSIIYERQEKSRLFHSNREKNFPYQINQLLPIQDEYSIYEIDQRRSPKYYESTQENYEQEQRGYISGEQNGSQVMMNTIQKRLLLRKLQEKQELINEINQLHSIEGLDIIKRELFKIKSMEGDGPFNSKKNINLHQTNQQPSKKIITTKKPESRELALLRASNTQKQYKQVRANSQTPLKNLAKRSKN